MKELYDAVVQYQKQSGDGYVLSQRDFRFFVKEASPNLFHNSLQKHALTNGSITKLQAKAFLSKSFYYYFGKEWDLNDFDIGYIMDDLYIITRDELNVYVHNVSRMLVFPHNIDEYEEDEDYEDFSYPFKLNEGKVGNLDDFLQAAEICEEFKFWMFDNIHPSLVDDLRYFKDEYVTYQKEKNKTIKKEETPMNKAKEIGASVLDANKNAAIAVAELTIGKAALKTAKKVIKPKLPMYARGYADGPLFDVIIANLVHIAVEARFKDNEKVRKLSKAMMTASALTVAEHFDIDGMIENFINEIKLPNGLKIEDIED